MKKITFIIFGIVFSNIMFSQGSNDYLANELIIKFKQNSNFDFKNINQKQKFDINIIDSLNNIFEVQSIKLTGNKKKRDTYILEFKNDQDIPNLIRLYKNIELFDYVEPNHIGTGGGKKGILQTIPNDTHFSRQWGLYNDNTFALSPTINDADIDMELAWDIEQGDSSIVVAVLDSGLKLNHPDINGRIWSNTNENDNGLDEDNNGYIDDVNGWDFANDDENPTDDHGHGTNVTGIIGADANNNNGYAGIDWNSKIMVCKILDQNNSGLYSWWSEAIYYAVDNGANVINMSVGGSGFSNTLQNAINYAYNNGVTVVACMMNENNNVTYYPAGFQNTIAVGSTNPNDERSSPFFWSTTSGSNYGNHIDVVAPGNYIYGLNYQSNTNYNTYWGGTSQATPLVTGLCALLLAQDQNMTPDEIRNVIRNTAEDQVGNPSEDVFGFDIYYGYGRINAHQALFENSLAVNDLSYDSFNLTVYPNPSSENLFIESNEIIKSVNITDMLGKVIYKKENLSNQNLLKIDISGLSSGTYFINASFNNGEIYLSQKIIKV